jgi:hypothetical protein
MITGTIEDLFTHYAELDARQNIAKKRELSYTKTKWLAPYKCLEQIIRSDRNDKQYFTDSIYGCKYIYDIKRDTWKCTS